MEPFAPGQYCDVRVNAEDLKDVRTMLMKYNIAYKVLINDVEDAVEEEYMSNIKNAFFGGFSYDKYNTYSEVNHLDQMAIKIVIPFNPFFSNAPFLYPLKTSCFLGVEKGCIGNKWVKMADMKNVLS